MRHLLFLFLAVAMFSACASDTGELRQTKPTRVKTYDGNYKIMANCVAEKVDEEFSSKDVKLRINEEKQYARVFMIEEYLGITYYDFLFKQDSQANKVIVESRGSMTIRGSDRFPSMVWPLVEQCASHENAKVEDKSFQKPENKAEPNIAADPHYRNIKAIVLKNGDVIEGQIISVDVDNNDVLKIWTKEGKISSYSMNDLKEYIYK